VGVLSVGFFSCWFEGGIPDGFVFLPISGIISLLSLIMFLQLIDSQLLKPCSFEESRVTKLPIYSLFTCKHTNLDIFSKIFHFSVKHIHAILCVKAGGLDS